VDLSAYLSVARRWWWLLLIATVIGGATAYLATQLVTPTYRASTTMLVVQQQDPESVGLSDLQASERLANTFSELITVRPVLERAIAIGGLTVTPEELEQRLDVTARATTQLLEVSAEASSPEAARDIANLVAETFIATNQSVLADRPGTVSVVERAEAPLTPSAPSPGINALIGAFLALVATATIVVVADYLDDTVKDDETVARLTGLPVVGYVPQFARPTRPSDALRAMVDSHSREAEAYRSMRTTVTFSTGNQDDRKRRLLFTSPGPGEGKSTTAANLAVVFGLAGSRVVLIDADLRRPSQHRIFGIPNTSGLTNLLAGSGVSLSETTHRTAYERVWLLPSGPIPANPSELLGSGRMSELLSAMEQHFDIIILDAPPVLAVTDPAVLSGFVSASVVVVQRGKTRSNELKNAVQRLAVAGKPIAGVVINRVSGQQPGYYYAEYRTQQTAAAEREARGRNGKAAESTSTPHTPPDPARPAVASEGGPARGE
jgi:polysaccharide biosynthesis transport protein